MIPIKDNRVKISSCDRFNIPIEFAVEQQLKNADMWRKFADQFRFHTDIDNGWRGEFWGKCMRGACLIQSLTNDCELKSIIDYTVDDILSCAESDGRISSYPKEKEFNAWDIWCRKYIMLGLQYYLEFVCTDEGKRQIVLNALCRHADRITDSIGKGKIEIYNASTHWQGINSSSILEPFVILYKLTKKSEYLQFCDYIVESGMASGFNLYETAKEGRLDPYQYPVTKAYEMMSCFEGILEYYTVTGKREYLDTVVDYAHRIAKTDVTVIGSCGCTHELFDNSSRRQTYTGYNDIMQETCVTVTWMKLCGKLLQLTNDGFFADQMEKSYYNAYLGAHNLEGNKKHKGLPYDSYSPLLPNVRSQKTGGRMVIGENDEIYGCCAAIAAVGGAIFTASAVRTDGDYTVIDFFDNISSKVDGTQIDVKTDYPSSGRISVKAEKYIKIKIRKPVWCESFSVSTPYSFDGEYIYLNCSECEIEFNMPVVITRCDGYGTDEASYGYISINKGPVLFGLDERLSGNIGMDEPVLIKSIVNNGSTDIKHNNCICFDSDKGNITMIDYASCGADWDNKTKISAFIKIRNL